ncbi:hypothetical protein MMPV_003067 [Pyropia vietnamensis]
MGMEPKDIVIYGSVFGLLFSTFIVVVALLFVQRKRALRAAAASAEAARAARAAEAAARRRARRRRRRAWRMREAAGGPLRPGGLSVVDIDVWAPESIQGGEWGSSTADDLGGGSSSWGWGWAAAAAGGASRRSADGGGGPSDASAADGSDWDEESWACRPGASALGRPRAISGAGEDSSAALGVDLGVPAKGGGGAGDDGGGWAKRLADDEDGDFTGEADGRGGNDGGGGGGSAGGSNGRRCTAYAFDGDGDDGGGCVNDELACAICLEDVLGGERKRTLIACGHAYHSACVRSWLRKANRCPQCNAKVCEHPEAEVVGAAAGAGGNWGMSAPVGIVPGGVAPPHLRLDHDAASAAAAGVAPPPLVALDPPASAAALAASVAASSAASSAAAASVAAAAGGGMPPSVGLAARTLTVAPPPPSWGAYARDVPRALPVLVPPPAY